jgi:uncharacterized membrane protein YgcG
MYETQSIWPNFNNDEYAEKIQANLHDVFELYKGLTVVLNQTLEMLKKVIQPELPISANEASLLANRRIVSFTLFIKTTNTLEAMVVLTGKTMEDEVEALFRVLFEAVVRLRAICLDESYLKKYLAADVISRQKLLTGIKNQRKSILEWYPNKADEYGNMKVEQQVDELNQKIRDERLNRDVFTIAKHCNMENDYDLVYRLLSEHAHVTPKVLDKYLCFEDEKIIGLNLRAVDVNNLTRMLVTGLSYYLMGMQDCIKLFGYSETKEFTSYNGKVTAYLETLCAEDK